MNKRNFMQSVAALAFTASYAPVFALSTVKHSMTGVDSDGKPFNLGDFSGKFCLVSFFTAGCNLCTIDLKQMREFYGNNRSKDFVLIGVNIDAKHDDFMEYASLIKQAVPTEQRFPLLWRNTPHHTDTFGTIVKQPTHFVLNKKLEQVSKREGNFRPEDWDQLWTNFAA